MCISEELISATFLESEEGAGLSVGLRSGIVTDENSENGRKEALR